ncbi:MAG: heat-inducible transcriptional repressor HrcA [Pseudomonadota bacterium]
MNDASATLAELNERSREIFRRLVESYLATGEPVGSRTLSKQLQTPLSAASIRNVMQDLEHMGLLDSPHVSAGRRPTHRGLRLFVDAMLEVGGLSPEERRTIEDGLGTDAASIDHMLGAAGSVLSGLAGAASLVTAPKTDAPVKHVDFVALSDAQILVILVKEDGAVENRLISAPPEFTPSALQEAANFLNAQLRGKTLAEAQTWLTDAMASRRRELGAIAAKLVEAGLADWGPGGSGDPAPERLIVRGRANLLSDQDLGSDLERMRQLFEDLERQADLAQLVDLADHAEGVRIFIGAENKLFSMAGSSLVISPYVGKDQQVVGAIGVIGPTRMNYGRIVPIVDYTARLMSQLMADRNASGG